MLASAEGSCYLLDFVVGREDGHPILLSVFILILTSVLMVSITSIASPGLEENKELATVVH
jgi:hypothetical protein